MKLLKLKIKGYKNLDFSIDFEDSSLNYLTIIGLNGTGKSNVLEAIGVIFKETFYRNLVESFEFYIEYTKGQNIIKLDNQKMYINSNTKPVPKKEYRNYLPQKIVACYSGEEQRLWQEVFARPYNSYFYQIRKNIIGSDLKFLYVNKFSWDKALLTLLCHPDHRDFILNFLQVHIDDVKVFIDFSGKYDNYEEDYGSGFQGFINFIKTLESIANTTTESQSQSRKQIANTQSLTINSFTTMNIDNIENSVESDKWCRRFFNYLFLASMPKDKKLIKNIEIDFSVKSLRNLSEGQKKLILVECITRILADENTIMLFDEPDSHVHLDKKQDIINAVNSSRGFSIMTTHSPTLVNFSNTETLYKLSDGKLEKIQESYEGLSHLVSQRELQQIFFSTKDIIICEGKTDEIYINKAIETFRSEYPNLDFEFILSGGTDIDNLNKLLFQITTNNNVDRKIIVLVDRDDAGLKVYKGLNIGSSEKQHLELVDVPDYPNTKFLMLPVTENFLPSGNFVIEDYFGTETLRTLAIQLIQDEFKNNSSYTKFPKIKDDIKQKHLKKFCEDKATSESLKGFKTLLNILNRVVDRSA